MCFRLRIRERGAKAGDWDGASLAAAGSTDGPMTDSSQCQEWGFLDSFGHARSSLK